MPNRFREHVAKFVQTNPLLIRFAYSAYRILQTKYSVGVVGILIDDTNRVLLVEHVFHPRLPWGLPGGWVDFNEDPQHGVKRELSEELGLRVQVEYIVALKRTQYNHLDIAYLVSAESMNVSHLSSELLSYAWYPVDDLPPLNDFQQHAIQEALLHIQRVRSWQLPV